MPKLPRRKVTIICKGRTSHTYLSSARPDVEVPIEMVPKKTACTTSDPLGIVEDPIVPNEEQIPQTHNTKPIIVETDAWEQVKEELRISFYESCCPEDGLCVVCQQKPDVLVTCRECSRTGHVFCRECAIKMHKQHCLLHTIVEWQDDKPDVCSYECTFSRPNHECSTMFPKSVKVFNDRGPFHHVNVWFCKCEPPAATLVRYGLWPCSAKMPATAISLNFMDLVYCMMMEGQVSLKAICYAAANHANLLQDEANLLYRCIVGECMEQFRYFRHMIKNLQTCQQNGAP